MQECVNLLWGGKVFPASLRASGREGCTHICITVRRPKNAKGHWMPPAAVPHIWELSKTNGQSLHNTAHSRPCMAEGLLKDAQKVPNCRSLSCPLCWGTGVQQTEWMLHKAYHGRQGHEICHSELFACVSNKGVNACCLHDIQNLLDEHCPCSLCLSRRKGALHVRLLS